MRGSVIDAVNLRDRTSICGRWLAILGSLVKLSNVTLKTSIEETMEHEIRATFGVVPHSLSGEELCETSWHLLGDEFLLRGEGDHYFHYRKGAGVRIERGANADASEESLWLNGSVYAAVASLNGLLPIHASAVAYNGEVFAFTGPAGAGKSTLVAALGDRGIPMLCDDTLVLDLADEDNIRCLPGHKRLKLAADMLELTQARANEKVSATVDKYFAEAASGVINQSLPLSELIFLEEGSGPSILPLRGAERFLRVDDDHYTALLFGTARKFDRASRFAHRARLARQLPMARFIRPFDRSRFEESVTFALRYITRPRQ